MSSASSTSIPQQILQLQAKIEALEEEIQAAKNAGAAWNDPALVGLRADKTAIESRIAGLQEEKNILLKQQQSNASTGKAFVDTADIHTQTSNAPKGQRRRECGIATDSAQKKRFVVDTDGERFYCFFFAFFFFFLLIHLCVLVARLVHLQPFCACFPFFLFSCLLCLKFLCRSSR